MTIRTRKNNNKKHILLVLATFSILPGAFALSCTTSSKKNEENDKKTDLKKDAFNAKDKFQELKGTNFETDFSGSLNKFPEPRPLLNSKSDSLLERYPNVYTIGNLQLEDDLSEDDEEEEEEYDEADDEIKRLKDEIRKKKNTFLKDQASLKLFSIASSTLSAITSSISTGITTYLGISAQNGENAKQQELDRLKRDNMILKEFQRQYIYDPLINVFERFLEIGSKAGITTQAYTIIETIICSFFDSADEEIKQEIKAAVLTDEFTDSLKQAIMDLLAQLTKVDTKKTTSVFIEQIKYRILEILPTHFPTLLRLVMRIITKVSQVNVKNQTITSSVLGTLIIRLLDEKGYSLRHQKTKIAKIIENIASWFASSKNSHTINLITKALASAIEKHEFSVDMKTDFVAMIRGLIDHLFENEKGNLSLEKVLNSVVPTFLSDLEVEPAHAKDFTELVNTLFEENKVIWDLLGLDRPRYNIDNKTYLKDLTRADFKKINIESYFVRNNAYPRTSAAQVSSAKPQTKPSAEFTTEALDLPKINIEVTDILKLIFTGGKYATMFKQLFGKIFEPFIIEMLKELKTLSTLTFNQDFGKWNIARSIPSFRALFRVTTSVTYFIYKLLNKNPLLFDTKAGYNIFALQKTIPETVKRVILNVDKDNILTSANLEYILKSLFGNYDKKNIWQSMWYEFKQLFHKIKDEPKDNIFYVIKHMHDDENYGRVQDMLMWGHYLDN